MGTFCQSSSSWISCGPSGPLSTIWTGATKGLHFPIWGSGSPPQLSRGEEGGRGKKYVLNYRYIFSLFLRSHSKKDVSPLLSPRKPFNPPNHLRCPCRAPPDQTSYSSAVVSPTKSGIDRIWSGGVRAVGVRASALKRLTLIRNHHVSFALWVFGRHSLCISFSERLNRRTIL